MGLSKQTRDSLTYSAWLFGIFSTILSFLGFSLKDIQIANYWCRIVLVIVFFGLIVIIIHNIIGRIFKQSVDTIIRGTPVSIVCGNIFSVPELRVIGCDNHFDTRIDDIVISKKSLHGQLVLEHGRKNEIKNVIEKEASQLGLKKDSKGLYDFPLGTIIRYNSSVDNHTYLLLAMIKLNNQYEAHTNMAEFENTLMKMWKEINRVYASHDVALPLLGTGIVRFDDGLKEKESLLRCMLCTLNSSGVNFNSKVKIIIYGNNKDISLYEYKDLFYSIQRR